MQSMNFINNVYAQTSATTSTPAAAPAGAQPQMPAQSFMSMIMLFGPMFVVIYFFIIRPQNKKMKEHQSLINQIKSGDEIITSSGILGKVTGVTEKVLTVEVADGVRIKMLKSQAAQVNPQLNATK